MVTCTSAFPGSVGKREYYSPIMAKAGDFRGIKLCGTPEPTHEQIRQTLEIRDAPPPPDDKIVIDTYIHLVYSEDNSAKDFKKRAGKQVCIPP